MRDVDRLYAQPDTSGTLRLEIRNEALETHYINHLELLSVDHRADETVYPAKGGTAFAVSELIAPSARDSRGVDVSEVIGTADDRWYRVHREHLDVSDASDLHDHIDLRVPRPESDSAAVIVRARNSLLNTLLFYEYMLGRQGPRSLDYLGQELESIGPAAELGVLYQEYMGLRISVREAGHFREVSWRGNTGPIAWDEFVVPFEVPDEDWVAKVQRGLPPVVAGRFFVHGAHDAD